MGHIVDALQAGLQHLHEENSVKITRSRAGSASGSAADAESDIGFVERIRGRGSRRGTPGNVYHSIFLFEYT